MDNSQSSRRQEYIPDLSRFCAGICDAARTLPGGGDSLQEVLEANLTAECVQCGIRLNGSELLSIGGSEPVEDLAGKLARMRQGYCSRNGCQSYYYYLDYRAHPEVDWPRLFAHAEAFEGEYLESMALSGSKTLQEKLPFRLAAKVMAGLIVLMILLGMRQWYLGGPIPLIRQPEYFEVEVIVPVDELPSWRHFYEQL